MNGFVPGALAMVIQCRSIPENIGKTVVLIRRAAPSPLIEDPDGHLWKPSGNGLVAWLVESAGDYLVHPEAGPLRYVVIAECRLMPLSGDTTQFEKEQEKELVNG